jgi:hypothetical protein
LLSPMTAHGTLGWDQFRWDIDIVFNNWYWLPASSLPFQWWNVGPKNLLSDLNILCSHRVVLNGIHSNDGFQVIDQGISERM